MSNIRELSSLLLDLKRLFKDQDTVSIGDVLDGFHERGFGFFLFIFSLPAALPLPAVGIGTILALPLLFLTTQMAFRRQSVWLPQSLQRKSLTRSRVDQMIDSALPWTGRIELLIKPRLGWVTQGLCSRLTGVAAFIMSVSVLFPVPLTNTVPALGIASIAAGLLMRDGLAIMAGILVGIVWITLLVAAVVLFGTSGIDFIKDLIRGLF